MTIDTLEKELKKVDWDRNRDNFLQDKNNVTRLTAANLRLAIWARQLEAADRENPALCFIREMQASGHHVAIVTSLGLYKVAAASGLAPNLGPPAAGKFWLHRAAGWPGLPADR